MKILKKLFVIMLCLALTFSLFACGYGAEEDGDYYGGYEGGYGYDYGYGIEYAADIGVGGKGAAIGGLSPERIDAYEGGYVEDGYLEDGETEITEKEPSEEYEQLQSGLITASAWNDNQYYEYYKTFFARAEEKPEEAEKEVVGKEGEEEEDGLSENDDSYKQPQNGKFACFLSDNWGFDTLHRVTVKVADEEGAAVAGASVAYYNSKQQELFAVTDANGVAYIFPDTESGNFTVKSGEYSAVGTFDEQTKECSVTLGGKKEKTNVIKLMFVVDVTGSMGDELNYLKTELTDVIHRVALSNEDVRIDLALLFYRDDGDDEKFAYYDFLTVTEEANLEAQLKNLKKHYATGGGDYPEALDEAILMATEKDWGEENSTKIIFHIFDAPPHTNTVQKERYDKAVKLAAKKGIRVNPVLCSGADLLCEYLARQTAIQTAGYFIYITDHSGIGDTHYDPDIPNAVVEKLNELIIRLINGFHSGTFAEPVPWNEGVSPDGEQ